MNMNRSTFRLLSLSLPMLLGAASRLPAQDRQLFTWNGHVDREVQITMRGRHVWTNGAQRDDERFNRVRVSSALPQTDGYVRVESVDGRGDVAVIQQPSARNGYTAVVRVRDRGRGADNYRVRAYWDSRYADNRGYGRRGDRDDGDWQQNRDDRPRIESRGRGNGGWGYGSGTVLHWSGSVDNELEIRIQGRRVDERTLAGGEPRNQRTSTVAGIPQRDVQLVIDQRQGRGTVYVAQQPTAYNGYTAVVRVRDPQGGYGYYDFDVEYR